MRMPLAQCWTRGSALSVLVMISTITVNAVSITGVARETKMETVLAGNQGETHAQPGEGGHPSALLTRVPPSLRPAALRKRTAAFGSSTLTSARTWAGSGFTNPRATTPISAWGPAPTSGAWTRSTARCVWSPGWGWDEGSRNRGRRGRKRGKTR